MRPDIIPKKLEQAGFEAYYVGGCVRDALLGRPVHDWDITTSARPEQVMALFSHCVPTGLQHGTVTVFDGGACAEVTTFRKDGAYHDSRHPDGVTFVSNLKEDLARRDFTINAMALDLRGRLTDCFGGQDDLRRGVIRCVGNPARRFQEDALRMLRAMRFSAQLGFSIADPTRLAIEACAPLCAALSKERVSEETQKTLLSPNPALLSQMISLGLLAACNLEGHYDLSWLGTLPCQIDIRWAALHVLIPTLDLRAFRLPAARIRLAEAAAAAYRPAYTRLELKRLIANTGEDTARVCAALAGCAPLLDEILSSGECVSLRTLAVTGRDFPALSGKAVGAALHALLEHVLEHPEDNDRQTLLSFLAMH